MIRLACFLGLIALAVLLLLMIRLDGATAIAFSFIGLPALSLALTVYAVARWRAGAFRFNATLRNERS
jgi:hypothetical protein